LAEAEVKYGKMQAVVIIGLPSAPSRTFTNVRDGAVRHARAITVTFQLAEVAVIGTLVSAILAAIHRLRAPPSCA